MTEATKDSSTNAISVGQWCSRNRHFLVVATILTVVWTGWTGIMHVFDMVFQKEAVPWPAGVEVDPVEFRMLSLAKSFGLGNRLASGSHDKTIKLWDTVAGKELLPLKGHSGEVYSVAFSPDGRYLASGGSAKTIKLWDAVTGKELLALKGHLGHVFSVAFSPDGKYLASGSSDGTIKLWDTVTGKELLTLEGRSGEVYSVAFSPDGKRLASGSEDRTIRFWLRGTVTGKELLTFKKEPLTLEGHSGEVYSVAFSPDGKRLASGSQDKTIKLWNSVTGKELLALEGHSHVVRSIAFSPDGKRLASGSYDKTIKLWDSVTGKALLTLKGHSHEVRAIAFSPGGKRLASGSRDKTIKLWDSVTGKELLALKGHSEMVYSVAFGNRFEQAADGELFYPRDGDLFVTDSGELLEAKKGGLFYKDRSGRPAFRGELKELTRKDSGKPVLDDIPDGEKTIIGEVLESLAIGTPLDFSTVDDRKSTWYVSRTYVDRQKSRGRKYRLWQLDVTYYTGTMDKAPHFPERCLQAAGMILGNMGNVEFEVPDAPGPWGTEPVICRAVEYNNPRGTWENLHVQYYVYSLNGYPESSWKAVRLKMASVFGKYAYFAKIQFNPLNEIGDPKEAKQAAEEFVKYMLPEVLKALPTPEDIKRLEFGAP